MQSKQNLKDSFSQSVQKKSKRMKISLFYKPLIIKAYIFVFLFVLLTSMPIIAYAGLFSDIMDVFRGDQVQAAEKVALSSIEPIYNSQTIPLLESSIDPDMKNMKESPSIMIVEDEALYPTDFFIGSGIENIFSGEIITYEVQQGDTLSQIAENFNISQNTIRWENNLSGSAIKVGQKLSILPVTGVKHIVKKGDTFNGIAKKYDADLDDMLIYNGLLKTDTLKVGDVIIVPNGIINASVISKPNTSSSSLSSVSSNTKAPAGYYIRPAVGKVTSPYGPRKGSFHYGVDIGNKRGTSVIAAASGTVVKVLNYCLEGNSKCGGGYGNYITIEHPNGTKTKYAHLQKVSVSVGQKVSQGEKIGTIGNTGRSSGPHLHFEVINKNGSTMRPPVY